MPQPLVIPKGAVLSPYHEPVFLTAEGVIESSSGATLNTKALANPLTVPIEIQEIRWQVSEAEPTDTTVNGLSMACQLTYGPLALTNGFIPVWNFGRMYNQYEDYADYHEYRWRLAEPLFVAPGGLVEPKFQHLGLVKSSLRVRISYLGRTVPKHRPKTIRVPYVAAYISDALDAFADGVVTTESRETDLLNGLNEPLDINRFVGRMNLFQLQDDGEVINTNFDPFVFDVGNFLSLEMNDSDGYANIQEDTLFWEVFNPQFRCWDVQHQISPEAYYMVKLAYSGGDLLSEGILPATLGPTYLKASISMIGSREVKTS